MSVKVVLDGNVDKERIDILKEIMEGDDIEIISAEEVSECDFFGDGSDGDLFEAMVDVPWARELRSFVVDQFLALERTFASGPRTYPKIPPKRLVLNKHSRQGRIGKRK